MDELNDNLPIMEPTDVMQSRLAQMYIIIQPNANSFSPEEALEKGTAFPGLYSPYNKAKGDWGI